MKTPLLLGLAEMGLRRAQKGLRGKMRKDVGQSVKSSPIADSQDNPASKLGQAALLYGVSRFATRSVPGALLVGGGFLAKRWLDKRTVRRKAETQHSE